MVIRFKTLVLEKDTIFNESIEVEESITCKGNRRFSLKVRGNINAGNINAGNIDAWNINAGNIDALDLICETRKKKSAKNKTSARIFIENKSKLITKEW